MRLSTLLLRRIHKWVGLVLGLQFVLWTISGSMMALLDMKTVSGGPSPRLSASPPLPSGGVAWPRMRQSLGAAPVTAIAVRPLLGRHVYEVTTPTGVRLFDAQDGQIVEIDAALARNVAEAGYSGHARVKRISKLDKLTLAVREHELPIWRIDFADDRNSSFYVSGTTGQLLERRNDTWRIWDFFWMLHNMDYLNRTSFNHPVIVVSGFGIVWLAITGFYLLFRTAWKPDLRWVRRKRSPVSAATR